MLYQRKCVTLQSETKTAKYMQRKLYSSLLEWKRSDDRKPLILEGARQVGKTYLLKEFGRNEYDNLVYINCHDNSEIKSIFEQDLDVNRIIQSFEAYTGKRIIEGRTLLFIDEIQEAPHAVESLKYFCEKARGQHVVVAGSLLGVINRPGESYPVGKVNIMRLYPMTFEEFLLAKGMDKMVEAIEQCDWDLLKVLEVKLQEYLRQYYYVGGMPEVVATYISKGDITKVRAVQNEILESYYNDFAKHAGSETQRIRMVWNSIPSQLSKENKKFIYGAIKKGGRAKEFEMAIQWLVDAGLVNKVYRCKTPSMPLKIYEDIDAFKLYLNDVGLLGALSGASAMQMLVSNNVFKEFKGAFTENYVLQQLKAKLQKFPIYYYTKEGSTMEIDFVVQTSERIVPVEVKAEENVKSKSLSQFINVDFAGSRMRGLRCSMLPYRNQEWMENIPLCGVGGYFDKL